MGVRNSLARSLSMGFDSPGLHHCWSQRFDPVSLHQKGLNAENSSARDHGQSLSRLVRFAINKSYRCASTACAIWVKDDLGLLVPTFNSGIYQLTDFQFRRTSIMALQWFCNPLMGVRFFRAAPKFVVRKVYLARIANDT